MPLSLSSPSIKRCFNLEDFRQLAKRKLPAPLFHYIDGGADDELSRTNNTQAFNHYQIVPRCLSDVTTINMQARGAGLCELDWPGTDVTDGHVAFFSPPGRARSGSCSGTIRHDVCTLNSGHHQH